MNTLFDEISVPSLRLTYLGADGQITVRDVAPDFGAASVDEFQAWCFLRNEHRSFQFARIQEAVRIETGEILGASGVFALFFPANTLPVMVLLRTALPLAHFLVEFARYQVGKYKPKQHAVIAAAIQERLAPNQISSADIVWWITEGLPNASELYESIEVLASRLDADNQRIARRATLALVGTSQSPVALNCLELIGKLFPEG